MKSFSYYLIDKIYDDNGIKYGNSARVRTDGPIRCNSIGMIFMSSKFKTVNTRCDYYCLYLIEGRLTVYRNDTPCYMNAGDFVIFPPNEEYKYEETAGNKIAYYLIHFSGNDVERFLHGIGILELPYLGRVGLIESIESEFSSIFDSFIQYDSNIQEFVSIGVQKILLTLSAAARDAGEQKPFSKSISYINSHYNEQITVSELAKLENMSESRFYAKFKSTVGKSPIDYVTSQRMKRACMLIINTPMKLNEIGATVGYVDNHFFSKHFKKHIGVSPLEYRRMFSGDK